MTTPGVRRMRSAAVNIGMVGVLAFAISGCANTNSSAERRCVDQTNDTVVTDDWCADESGGGGRVGGPYGWYYGGRSTGGRVTGGSYARPSGVDSGGFGESGRSRGTGG